MKSIVVLSLLVWTLFGVLLQARAAPLNVRLGVMFPSAGEMAPRGRKLSLIMFKALRDGVNVGLCPLANITMIDSKDLGTPVDAIRSASRMHAEISDAGPVAAFLGAITSDVAIGISHFVTAYDIPFCTPSAVTQVLSDMNEHPMAYRTIANDNFTGWAYLALCQKFGWRHVALIHTDDPYGQGMLAFFATSFVGPMSFTPFQVPLLGGSDNFRRAFEKIKAADIRVIFFHAIGTYIEPLLDTLKEERMNEGFTWVGAAWASPQENFTRYGPLLRGFVGVASVLPRGEKWDRFVSEMLLEAPSLTKEAFGVREAATYDCVTSTLLAMQQVLSSNRTFTGPNLLRSIRNISFESFRGTVRFSPTGDILTAMEIFNYDDRAVPRLVGNVHPVTRNISLIRPIIWTDGTTRIPYDRSRLFETGDKIPYSMDSTRGILSFSISALGCWTSLLLVEQALASYQHFHKFQSPKWTDRYGFYGWLGLASLPLGLVGMWSSHLIGYTAITLPIPVAFSRVESLLALPLDAVLTFLALCCEMANKRQRNVRLLDALRKSKISLTPPGTAGEDTDNLPMLYTARRCCWKRFSKCMASRTTQFFRGVSWWTAGAALILSGASMGTERILTIAFRSNCTVSQPSYLVFFSFGLCVLISIGGIYSYFHVLRSKLRPLCAFLLAAALYGSHAASISTLYFTYDERLQPDPDHVLTSQAIETIVAGVAATVCFVFVIINVIKLKLSRTSLDNLLSELQKQLRTLEKTVAAEKRAKKHALSEVTEKQRHLELINFCRPLLRNESFAFALADSGGVSSATAPTIPSSGAKPDSSPGSSGSTNMKTTALFSYKNERHMMQILHELNNNPQLDTGPVQHRAVEEVRLAQLMGNPVTLEILKDSLFDSVGAEIPALLLDIQRYRTLDKFSTRVAIATEMYAHFLAPDAPFWISNIDPSVIAALADNVQRRRIAPDLFDEVEKALIEILEETHMDAFTSTSAFKICCLLLQHSSYRLTTSRTAPPPHMLLTGADGSLLNSGTMPGEMMVVGQRKEKETKPAPGEQIEALKSLSPRASSGGSHVLHQLAIHSRHLPGRPTHSPAFEKHTLSQYPTADNSKLQEQGILGHMKRHGSNPEGRYQEQKEHKEGAPGTAGLTTMALLQMARTEAEEAEQKQQTHNTPSLRATVQKKLPQICVKLEGADTRKGGLRKRRGGDGYLSPFEPASDVDEENSDLSPTASGVRSPQSADPRMGVPRNKEDRPNLARASSFHDRLARLSSFNGYKGDPSPSPPSEGYSAALLSPATAGRAFSPQHQRGYSHPYPAADVADLQRFKSKSFRATSAQGSNAEQGRFLLPSPRHEERSHVRKPMRTRSPSSNPGQQFQLRQLQREAQRDTQPPSPAAPDTPKDDTPRVAEGNAAASGRPLAPQPSVPPAQLPPSLPPPVSLHPLPPPRSISPPPALSGPPSSHPTRSQKPRLAPLSGPSESSAPQPPVTFLSFLRSNTPPVNSPNLSAPAPAALPSILPFPRPTPLAVESRQHLSPASHASETDPLVSIVEEEHGSKREGESEPSHSAAELELPPVEGFNTLVVANSTPPSEPGSMSSSEGRVCLIPLPVGHSDIAAEGSSPSHPPALQQQRGLTAAQLSSSFILE